MKGIFKEHEEHMKKAQEIGKIEENLKTASPEQLKNLFDFLSKDSFSRSFFSNPNEAYYHGGLRQYTIQNDENGKIKFFVAKLNDGTGLAVLKTKNGFAVIKGEIREGQNDLFSVHGNEVSDYDENSNLLKQTVYEPDDSYKVQKFENGKLKSTSFYDKDNNLIKRINKKGDAERRKISDDLDELNEMTPSPLRRRLKRTLVKEYRQNHPKTKRGLER